MEWSPQQAKALDAFRTWQKAGYPGQIFRLFGFAGTGKTTLVRHIAANLSREVCFAAYTGKAALVMRRHGCVGATTIHQLIYKAEETSDLTYRALQEQVQDLRQQYLVLAAIPDATTAAKDELLAAIEALEAEMRATKERIAVPRFYLNPDSRAKDAELIIIDECSMVGQEIGRDLCSYKTPILVIGDPGQLPPIGDSGFFTNEAPDAMLEEIHRQAQESPIIELSRQVRLQQRPRPGDYGACQIRAGRHFDLASAMEAEQIIVGRNRTRKALNQQVRRERAFPPDLPAVGDKVVCLRNNHTEGLLNGALFQVSQVSRKKAGAQRVWLTLRGDGIGEEGEVGEKRILSWVHHFQNEEESLDPKAYKEANYFDYGYALTCHKSQGSQWKEVVVRDESTDFRQDRWRWLYTAITRAEERLTLYTDDYA